MNNKDAYKYMGLHELYETLIYLEMITEREGKINKNTIYKMIPKNIKLCSDSEILASSSFKRIYKIDILVTIFNPSLNNVYYLVKLFRYDFVGIKK